MATAVGKRSLTSHQTTPEEAKEITLCSPLYGLAGFLRFCERHVRIKCRKTGQPIPFVLWAGQKDIAALLVVGLWLWIVKARQLGITWLVSAYLVWRAYYDRYFGAVVMNQSLDYAQKFIAEKIKFIHDHLPPHFKLPIQKDTTQYIKFGSGGPDSLDSEITAVAGNENAARSDTLNVFFSDEASRIPEFEAALQAAEPTLKNTNGQAITLSSSAGPIGLFYRRWERTAKNGLAKPTRLAKLLGPNGNPVFPDGKTYFPDTQIYIGGRWVGVFLPWDAHPERDRKWYEIEEYEHQDDPNYMRQEFPTTPEEAFEASGGRVYPSFKRRELDNGGHILKIADPNPTWPAYRAIDWGESSMTVCLWLYHIPSKVPMLTIDPECPYTIEQMLGYCRDEKTGKPIKKDDHCPDALRYAVVTFQLVGHVHVYREWCIANPTKAGYDTAMLCAGIRERSGWELVDTDNGIWRPTDLVESYKGTVFDRSKPMLANEFWKFDISAWGHVKGCEARMSADEEVESGIRAVNRLILSAMPYETSVEKTQEQIKEERRKRADVLRNKTGIRSGRTWGDWIQDGIRQRRRKAMRMGRGRQRSGLGARV